MLAGRAYALRDDLNVTSGENQSSEPYVLVDYAGADGRPSMEVFQVLREKPSDGLVFDYIVEAGTMLQAPMPLPLIEQPTYTENGSLKTRNVEIESSAEPNNWSVVDSEFRLANDHYSSYTYEDRKQNKYVYRGRHEGPPVLAAGYYNASDGTWSTEVSATVKAGGLFAWHLHVSQIKAMVSVELGTGENIPEWVSVDGHLGISFGAQQCDQLHCLQHPSGHPLTRWGVFPSHGDSLPDGCGSGEHRHRSFSSTSESCLSKRQWSSSRVGRPSTLSG